MLDLSNVVTGYGHTTVLHGVSLNVQDGEIVALVGANGAGKTTLLNTISGILRPRHGAITFGGRALNRMAPHRIVRLGLSHVPEGRQLFGPLSVRDNLLLGTQARRATRAEISADLGRMYGMFPILEERAEQFAETLSGGEQQMLAIGRALMARPKLLLLDEPSMGLAPRVIAEVFSAIASLRKTGLSVLLVEQNARWALRTADRGYVLETGNITLQGPAQELLANHEVQQAYLGRGYHHAAG